MTHVVGTLSHKGIARRALPASGVKGEDGGGGIEKKIKVNDTHAFSMKRSSGASKVPFPSPRVQSLQRPSILCNPRLVFFFRCQEPFCLQSITDNTGEALFVEYVIGIRVVSMEVVSPDL